ncbi:Membrane protein involved in the export of O-antigen and teichoic acid [Bacteroides luti]|uniref:Membrane protein involved in the export of O-antigen and teichoic acid n=1 Tax=Bacteroides luti TaxID=1297750 RepID=A0A1M4ZBW0_9BACE|nr:oligosaccharide flippase family protein [Bacteroides luti]SHF15448.1 Membrane protein involved in the export of O-antigen and teichoic acid [Bacteroides luti]
MKELIKNSATLLSANAISQGIAFAVLPVIARLYSPDELGILALFLGIEGLLSVIANGKYDSAIVLSKSKSMAANTFNLCFLINAVFSLLILIVLLLGSHQILSILHYESLEGVIYYLPFFVFIVAFAQASIFWFNYNKRFALTARYTLWQGLINNGLKVGSGFLKAGLMGLVWANLSSHFISILSCFTRKETWNQLFHFNKKEILVAASEHRKFPLYTLPHTFINMVSGNLPILLLSGYFGMAEIGLFSMGITIGFRPINLLSTSLDQVISQSMAERINKLEPIWTNLIQSIKKILLIVTPLFILAFFLSPLVLRYFLGERWEQSALYIQIMIPWLIISLFTASLSSIPPIFGKQRIALIIEIIYIVARLISLIIGIYIQNFVWAIILFSFVSAVVLMAQLTWYLLLVKKYEQSLKTI